MWICLIPPGSPGEIKPIDLACDNNAAVSITFRGNDAVSLNTWEVTMPQPPLSRHHVTSLPPSNFSYAEQKSLIWKGIPANAAASITHCACGTSSMATVSEPETGDPLFSLRAQFHFSLTWRLRIARGGDKRLHDERWMAWFRFGWHRVG